MVTGLVTTIIPVYNRAKMLREAVESVIQQRYRPIEIIIIDDGSTDDTLKIARALSTSHKYIEVTSIKNSGPAQAREIGRQLAQGEFIQYLDSDDLLHANKFTNQVTGLREQPHCGVSYCVQQFCNTAGDILDPAWMRSGQHFKSMFPAMLGGRIWGTPVPLYRAELLQKSGPWLNLKNQEDWEYDCRIASLGVNLHYCPEVLVTIRQHNENHFGKIVDDKHLKLSDKAKAYQAIYKHAITANIQPQHSEFIRFGRMLFMLARQCAHSGLIIESQALMNTYRKCIFHLKHKLEYNLYVISSKIIGWQRVAKLTDILDRYRR